MRQETPETFDQDLNQSPTAPHTGALGSGGHGYNEDVTYAAKEPVLPSEPAAQRAGLGRGFWTGLLVMALLLACVVVYGIHTRSQADKTLAVENGGGAIPEVKVVYPTGGTTGGSLVLPGSTQPYVDTPIYSRTNGYLQKWYFDIGAHVRKGQLMATIETPELDQQLQAAQADLKSAQANLDLANITSKRYQNLLQSNSVSKQETDVAMGTAATKEAALESAMAGVRRLQQLQSFERVYAPFDGVVTARNTDIGDLITGGSASAGNAKQLFHLASIDRLRVFVSVPEAYSAVVRNGGSATVTLDEYPGETFPGVIARNASSIDPASRTLSVEVDVANPRDRMLPGAYASVHFNVPTSATNLTLPSNTLLFRAEGLQVGVVRGDHVQLVPVKIAQDHGSTVEITSGLTRTDAVIVDPADSLATNQEVKIKGSGAAKE